MRLRLHGTPMPFNGPSTQQWWTISPISGRMHAWMRLSNGSQTIFKPGKQSPGAGPSFGTWMASLSISCSSCHQLSYNLIAAWYQQLLQTIQRNTKRVNVQQLCGRKQNCLSLTTWFEDMQSLHEHMFFWDFLVTSDGVGWVAGGTSRLLYLRSRYIG